MLSSVTRPRVRWSGPSASGCSGRASQRGSPDQDHGVGWGVLSNRQIDKLTGLMNIQFKQFLISTGSIAITMISVFTLLVFWRWCYFLQKKYVCPRFGQTTAYNSFLGGCLNPKPLPPRNEPCTPVVQRVYLLHSHL